MTGARHDVESLLSETDWVRALARTLARDPASADDLAQEAYARALAAPPPAERPLRSWFARVLRNLARERRRGEGRRASRERAAARAEGVDGDAALLERLEAHRAVVEAVSRLDEPYRAAILLRWFEGLSPAQIAERTGVPIRTVHTRLSRALARLRGELDRSQGGRGRWLLAVVPFAAEPTRSAAAAIGALVMDAKIKVALAAAAVVGVCATFALREPGSGGPQAPALAAPEPPPRLEDPGPAPRPLEAATAAPTRLAGEPAPAPAAPVVAMAAPPRALRGRVIDVAGAPLGGVRVRATSAADAAPLEVDTGPDGRFALADPPARGSLEIAPPGWATVLRPELWEGRGEVEHVLVVAPAVDLAGVVVDAARRPIAGATVAVPLPFGLRSRFPGANLDSSSSVERSASTDERGRFELAGAPSFAGAELVTERATYRADRRPVPPQDEPALEIVLEPSRERPATISGRVVGPDGEPVPDAYVTHGMTTTKSGPDGAFALVADERLTQAPDGAWEEGVVQAAKAGYQGARFARPSVVDPWPDPLVLRLGPPPLAIRGRVVDADGQPLAGAQVWTGEERRLGFVEIAGGGMSMRVAATAESVARGETYPQRTASGPDGRFELRGLSARDYRVLALDPRTLGLAEASFAAGVENAELRLPREEVHERVAGRVTSLLGEPLAGVTVVFERRVGGEDGREEARLESAGVVTDAEGRFELRGLSKRTNVASVRGDDVDLGGLQVPLAPDADLEELELVVPLRLHVQVEGGPEPDFDQVAVLDERGKELALAVFHGTFAFGSARVRLVEGRTETFTVSEAAKTLVLFRGEQEVRRVALALARGEVNVVRP